MVISSTCNQREAGERSGALSNDLATELMVKLAGAQAQLGAASQELETLYGAIDHVHSGLLVLDGELCAQYINPALHTMFQTLSPEEIRNTRPRYADLLQGAAALPP